MCNPVCSPATKWLALGCLIIGCSCGPNEVEVATSAAQQQQVLALISSETGIVFPQNTRVINAARVFLKDPKLLLKAEVDRTDLERFVQSPPINGIKFQQRINLLKNQVKFRWWNPESQKNFKCGSAILPNGRGGFVVLLGLDNPDTVILFVVVART